MANVELKHTLAVDRHAWFIQFYVWLWEAKPSDITFCKLFWAYVFALPAVVIKCGIGYPMVLLLGPLVARAERRRKARPIGFTPKPTRTGPSTMQRVLGVIAGGAARIGFVASAVWDFVGRHKRLNRTLLWLAYALGLSVSLALVGGLVYLAVTYWSITAAVLILIGSVLVSIAFLVALAAIGLLDSLGRLARKLGLGTKSGVVGFAGVMKIGFYAVKSNTCPRIEVR